MIVKKVSLTRFMTHEHSELTLPGRGIVVITGANGAGKSAFVEAVSWVGWGETMRGTLPTENGFASVLTDKGSIIRERSGGRATVTWAGGVGQADTATKAQVALNAVFGSWEVWRRTHVFSSGDAAHFTAATDKARKLFLEEMVGLGRFDGALEACRVDLRKAMDGLAVTQRTGQRLQAELDGLTQRREDARRQLVELPPADPLDPTGLAAIRQSISDLVAGVRQTHASIRARGEAGAEYRAEAAAMSRRLQKMGQGACDACGQPIAASLREGLESAVLAAVNAAKGAQAAQAAELKDLQEQLADDESTLVKLREREAALGAALGRMAATARARKAAEATLATVDGSLATAQRAALEVVEALPGFEREVAVLTAAEGALGLKGARASMLGRLLGSLEAAANAWLKKLVGNYTLELRPYAEKKTGGVSDAIGLTVKGVGADLGYKAMSQGERRRLDLALLLAFAGSGTLFLDECLDALDDEGVEAAAVVMEELARDRCVVVITHNARLVERLAAVQRWRVSAGKLEAA